MMIPKRISQLLNNIVDGDICREKQNAMFDLTMIQPYLKGLTLRPYQVDGVKWVVARCLKNHGCILGDEMGLGKTCQTIAVLLYLAMVKQKRHFLVVCPLSVLANWKDEFEKFAPCLEIVRYIGNKETRENIQTRMNNGSQNYHVLLTTYEMVLKDVAFLERTSWDALVVDEAHRLKNSNSMLHQALNNFDVMLRFLLTGTPVQNNLRELYNLLAFIAPQIFKHKYSDDFIDYFANIDNKTVKIQLHDLLSPFLLRRTKSEVVLDLPKKKEVILFHGLTALQKKYYKAVLLKDHDAFEQGSLGTSKTRLMNIMIQLRKCVSHPYLFDGVEPEPFELGEHLVEASGKLHLLDQLLLLLYQQGHKVLIFSQMTRMLDVVQDYLGFRGYSYERLDGSVRGEERFIAIKNFNKDDNTFVFLLSTKAGGQGLNLVSADTVIFLDTDFNPQNDLQASARAHRIGQTRPVKIIRLIGKDSVEEVILRRADAKLKLTNSVIEGGQFSLGNKNGQSESPQQLSEMLKFGLDKLLEEKNSDEIDLEKILGPSRNGEWKLDQIEKEEEGEENEMPLLSESSEDTQTQSSHMYMFEGKDYSKETSAAALNAFDEMLAAEVKVQEESTLGQRSRRVTSTAAIPLKDLPQRKRKILTDEEKEEMRKKRQESAAKRARMREEAEVRRAEERKRKLEKMWADNDYESCSLPLHSDDEDEEEERPQVDIDDEDNYSLGYISGDVTHPINTNDKDALIVHCVDDSGSWGSGGLFSAIDARSPTPAERYELAGEMKDLSLGDAHLIRFDDIKGKRNGRDWLVLVVAQHRDKHNHLSGINLTSLKTALQKIYSIAKQKKASVHLPRIGYATPGFNWYGTERLLRKHLSAKGIPVFIYYYPRKSRQTQKQIKQDVSKVDVQKPSTSGHVVRPKCPEKSSLPNLPSFLHGVCIYFDGVESDQRKKLSRYIIAYDGDVAKNVNQSVTHIIQVNNEKSGHHDSQAKVVDEKWMWKCIRKQKLLKE
ncbi:chromodomain-helicase-DNA-binding protein 1-like [Anneissia japonica]|uniref:chromodomain-helicase-DNA-binding protein 1-like n=1 Tax=Anneissia japonica TaxID=1529436 RepID=UPI0014257147|nr:chromodomain-helicase-DNA-binding protein 1-like [Anneissia japonica]